MDIRDIDQAETYAVCPTCRAEFYTHAALREHIKSHRSLTVKAIAVLAGQTIAALWMGIALILNIEILAWVGITLFAISQVALFVTTGQVVHQYLKGA